LNDICASYQNHLCKILLLKLEKAIKKFKVKNIALAGGVSANTELRKQFYDLAKRMNVAAHLPKFEYCTDNAAMIGIAGWIKYNKDEFTKLGIAPKTTHSFYNF
jgi:N6-L-threonylcarbamoyladenine synthase